MPVITSISPKFNFLAGIGITLLMCLNVFGAVYPLYLFNKKDPLKVYISSMVIRILILVSALVYFYVKFFQNGLAFVLVCISTYIVFQVVEVMHLIKNKSLLEHTK